jgi:SagB-type dehydrogenase family enzyme
MRDGPDVQDRVASSHLLKLNPFFRLELGDPVQCELLLSERVLELPDPRYVELLVRLNEPKLRSEVEADVSAVLELPADQASNVVADLLQSELVVEADREIPELGAVRHWVDRGWLDALIFHLRTRNVPYSDDGQADAERIASDQLRAQIAAEGYPPFWKSYSDHPTVALPVVQRPFPAGLSLSEVLLQRRSNRPWKQPAIELDQLSSILHFGNLESLETRRQTELAARENPAVLLNSSFTAIETYVFVFSAERIAAGIYHYDLREHRLTLLREGLFRKQVQKLAIGQQRPSEASCVLVLTALWQRYMFRYRHSRAYRTLLVSVAELAQKYILCATAHGLSTFLTPNLLYEDADALLDLDNFEEGALYAIAIG